MASTDRFRKRLLQQRPALVRQVERAEDDLRWLDSNVEPEMLEEGQEESLALVLERLDDRGLTELKAIDRALARIAAGSFGQCIHCSRSIGEARLEALPSAEMCLACAESRERGV